MTCFLRSANRSQIVPNAGCREGVEQCKSIALCCCCSGCASVWCSVILKKHQPVSVINGTDSCFWPLCGPHLSLGVDFCTLDVVLLADVASVFPENGEHAFFSRRLSQIFFVLREIWGNDIQVTGFSFPGHSDASNSYHL